MKVLCLNLVYLWAIAACAEQYVVVYDDGAIVTGNAIENTYEWSFSTNAAAVGEHLLDRPGHKIRYIRDLHATARLNSPYIRMANGDLIPGVPSAILPADAERGLDKRLRIQVTAPCTSFHRSPSDLEIRLDRVDAIVPSTTAEKEMRPATLTTRDGRTIAFKSARWSEEGLKLLTSEGLQRVAFAELASFKAKPGKRWLAIQEDAAWPSPVPGDRLIQLRLINGAVLTAKHYNFAEVDKNVMAIQPAWAYRGIRFNTRDHDVSRSYRETNEVPLSLFPVETLAQKSYTGFLWNWQRDANIRGEELLSGRIRAAQGFGTHSYSALAVELPEGAQKFNSWVGIDHAVSPGGCVACSIYGDELKGSPIWESGFIRGGEEPKRIQDLDISKYRRLVVVTDYGHDKRPAGSDPLDIRDEVSWMHPIITLDKTPSVPTLQHRARIMDQLEGWAGAEPLFKDPVFGAGGLPWWGHWGPGLYVEVPRELRLKRKITVETANAWFQIIATRGRKGRGGHEIAVYVNGNLHEPRGWIKHEEDQYTRTWVNLVTSDKVAGFLYPMDYDLGRYAGQEITIEVVARPVGQTEGHPLPLLMLEDIRFRTAIRGLHDENDPPLVPEVVLDTLKAQQVDLVEEGLKLQPGKHANGKPITMFGWTFNTGYGVPAGSSLSYAIDPAWKRFVAIVGYTREGWLEIGPYQVYIDGELAQTTGHSVTRYGWWSRSQQIEVPIPAGSKTITLKIDEGKAWGAWAQAGFMTTAAPPRPEEAEEARQ